MNHPLDSAHLKIVWAQKHLDCLKREISGYVNANPHEIRVYEGQHGRAHGPAITVQPDTALSLIVGDCLTNARAALDYIMHGLCVRYFEPPFDITNRNHRNNSAFPLFDAPSTDRNSAYGNRFAYLSSMMPKSADAIDVVKSVQPYNSRYLPLWWLGELVNIDKHRLLLITRSDVVSATISANYYDGTKLLVSGHTTSIDELDILERLRRLGHDASSSLTTDKVTVESQPTIHVTLKDVPVPLAHITHIPVESVLQQIIETVVDVLPKFDQFF